MSEEEIKPETVQQEEAVLTPQTSQDLPNNEPPLNVKIVLVGDDGVGKTSICAYYKEGKSLSTDLPIILPNFAKKESHLNKKAILVLWDSACNEDYNEIRQMGYKNTNFFLLCFALNNKSSLENAEKIWLKEIQPYTKDAKVILVGTKHDIQSLSEKQIAYFQYKINPYLYIEISSKSGENIQQLFDDIVKISIEPNSIPKQIFKNPEKPILHETASTSMIHESSEASEKGNITKNKSTACLLI